MKEEKSLYKICSDAVNASIAESLLAGDAFAIDDAVKKAKEMTHWSEYDPEWMLEWVMKSYIAVYAHSIGFAAGERGEAVYFSLDILSEPVAMQQLINARKDASAKAGIAKDRKESYDIRFSKGGLRDQMAFDESMTLYQEGTIRDLSEMVKEAAMED